MSMEDAALEDGAAVVHSRCLRYARPGHVWSAEHHGQDRQAAEEFVRGMAGLGWVLCRDALAEVSR